MLFCRFFMILIAILVASPHLAHAKDLKVKEKRAAFVLDCLGMTKARGPKARAGLMIVDIESREEKKVVYSALPIHIKELVDRAEAAISSERYEDALAYYKQALTAKPDDAFLHAATAATYQLLGKHSEAIQQYEEALKIKADNVDSMEAIGDIYALSLADKMSALYWYAKAMKATTDPTKKKIIAEKISRFLASDKEDRR